MNAKTPDSTLIKDAHLAACSCMAVLEKMEPPDLPTVRNAKWWAQLALNKLNKVECDMTGQTPKEGV